MTTERLACRNGRASLQPHWVRVPGGDPLPWPPSSVSTACSPLTETTNGKVAHGKGNISGSHQALWPRRDDVALPSARGSNANITKKSMKSSDPVNSLSSQLRDQEMTGLEVTLGPWKGLGRDGTGDEGVLEPSRLPHRTPAMWMKMPRPREEE